jgi:hypothetical protein
MLPMGFLMIHNELYWTIMGLCHINVSKIYVLKSGIKVLNFNPNHAHKSSLPCQVILGILKMLTIKNFIGDSF